MVLDTKLLLDILIALGVALVISFAATPVIKAFAQKVGAIDVPRDARRVHDHPIPRMGGLAIFLGFVLSVVLFVEISKPVQGILLGAVLIVIVGALDDILNLPAWVKLLFQIIAAVIAVLHGIVIETFTNPFIFGNMERLPLNGFSIPVTIVWIVIITNSVNLIDGLDGLAAGVSSISGLTMLIIALLVADRNVALLLAALVGACIGFLPFNFNPAKIFMGDTGALLLGYVLSTASILGLFKFYAVVSFAVPFLVLAVPIFDTLFAIFRRLCKGQNPLKPDRGHFHHRLIYMGFNQKQTVAILYILNALLGLSAVIMTANSKFKVLILIVSFCLALAVVGFLMLSHHSSGHTHAGKGADQAASGDEKGDGGSHA